MSKFDLFVSCLCSFVFLFFSFIILFALSYFLFSFANYKIRIDSLARYWHWIKAGAKTNLEIDAWKRLHGPRWSIKRINLQKWTFFVVSEMEDEKKYTQRNTKQWTLDSGRILICVLKINMQTDGRQAKATQQQHTKKQIQYNHFFALYDGAFDGDAPWK